MCSAETYRIHLLPVSIDPQAKALQDKAKAKALEDKIWKNNIYII